jgi:4-diphosphocytidyl-2-C-methyl-D-erythritol kinase
MLLCLAAELGADVPAQVCPGRWLAQGQGERLRELPAASPELGVLVLPDAHALSTAAVYGELDRIGRLRSAAELSDLAVSLQDALAGGEPLPPPELMGNDLQAPALLLCPSIAGSLDRARSAGAEISLLSGSGPTVLGIYAGPGGPVRAERAAQELHMRGVAAHAATSVDASHGEVGVAEP